MKRHLQSVLLLLTGAGVLRVSLFSDISLRYVKEGLQPFLIVAGSVLVGLGLVAAWRDGVPFARMDHLDDEQDDHDDHDDHQRDGGSSHPHGHDHTHGPRVAWLLLPPALALLFFAPPALGSYTAARDSPKIVEKYARFEPLPAQGPVPLSLSEFTARAQQDEEQSLKGRTVITEGFVTPGKNGTWNLTRLLVSCCAADSQSLTIRMYGVRAPDADTWVRVTGTWHPGGTLGTASAAVALDVTALQRIPQPAIPYRDAVPAAG
ncbi:TIGR03943 family protein [Streptomyces sp. A3M-1-3]|uniref:TIGR03943 family putative permease subunit n=1 Tax=Streptomyces sp. A3M-1-3 TaxID=2962044 RepID=UPI0020B63EA6|nr:TIGR03943 family protein [Streptomyces sp. A3M-1-3]MCP3819999.1 TIGR03943 family protein [Streptomyces sp. A3M-1-3]